MISGARSDRPGVVGVVPVVRGDPDAPGGCAALRELRGVTLLRRAVECLAGSGRVDRVVVAFGPLLVGPELAGPPSGLLADALTGLVVVHDPRHALASGSLVREVVEELLAHPEADGVVPVRPVTDTVKRVGPDGVVTTTADREAFRLAVGPQAYRAAALARLWLGEGGPPRIGTLPGAVRRAGGRLRTVPAPGEVFAITTDDDLLLAEAVLAGSPRS